MELGSGMSIDLLTGVKLLGCRVFEPELCAWPVATRTRMSTPGDTPGRQVRATSI